MSHRVTYAFCEMIPLMFDKNQLNQGDPLFEGKK